MSYLNFSWILPGSLAGAQGPRTRRDLIYLHRNDIRAIVRMHEDTISGEVLDMVDLYEPVRDFTAPRLDQLEHMVRFLEEQIDTWERPVVVTCYAGLGRTGTVLACYMVNAGYTAQNALSYVRELRPNSVQTPEQELAVHQFADHLAAKKLGRKRRGRKEAPGRRPTRRGDSL